MTAVFGAPLEEQISRWRAFVRRRATSSDNGLEELERRLREHLTALLAAGLEAEEAWLVALRRLGATDSASRDYGRLHLGLGWRQAPSPSNGPASRARTELVVVLGLAVAAAVAVKLPALFGVRLDEGGEAFYARNAALFVFPLLTLYFVWKRGMGMAGYLWPALAFAGGAVFANVFPFRQSSDTAVLTALHLPIALWLVVGFAYVGGRWFTNGGRMDFVRFSGELFIRYVLIGLGGGVLAALTMVLFRSIGVDAQWLVRDWLIPCGAAGALLIGSWLVEAGRSATESLALMLTRVFTPLLTALLLGFLATLVLRGGSVRIEREVLIGYDLLLALVVGLVLYAVASREPEAPPGLFDGLQLLLVASALVADGVALAAIAARISEFGFTPNRTAALGENLILLVNLAGTAWLYARFLLRRAPFAALERWQVGYLPVYSVWAAAVVLFFPPWFGYR